MKMLDEKLLQERLNAFNPEALVEYDESKTKEDIEIRTIVEDENTIDLARTNFLNALNNQELKKVSEDIIREYGVGTCGPRAFYGTTDVHLELEKYIANFLGTGMAIAYSYGFVAISSSIAAYCKRQDVVFIDEKANFPIHQGLLSPKSRIVYFKHNDPESFAEEAAKVAESERNKTPRRKFLIAEAVSWKTGKILPLPQFLDIAEQYKMRVFLEETYSFGILGEHGKGITEHFNVDMSRVDMIIAMLETAVGSMGGLCAGSVAVIEHQQLSGSGYVFSASLPTYLVQACKTSIESFGDAPTKLRTFSKKFHTFLTDVCDFNVQGDPETPFKVFNAVNKDEAKIHQYCADNGVHFIKNEDSLLINLNVALEDDKKKLDKIYKVLKEAAKV